MNTYVHSPRAAPLVSKSNIPLLPHNNPYLLCQSEPCVLPKQRVLLLRVCIVLYDSCICKAKDKRVNTCRDDSPKLRTHRPKLHGRVRKIQQRIVGLTWVLVRIAKNRTQTSNKHRTHESVWNIYYYYLIINKTFNSVVYNSACWTLPTCICFTFPTFLFSLNYD